MALQELRVPHVPDYTFGVGVDRLSGMAHNLVVNPTPAPPQEAQGGVETFTVARVTTTQDLQSKLGIDLNASYGCAAFGAGISGRFSFSEDSQVHSASLFLTVTASVHEADLSIPEVVLTPAAAQVIGQPDVFAIRYGDMFLRACQRGGLFVGVMRVETFDEAEATSIEGDLNGSYGLFSASASTNFSKVATEHHASMYCTVYSEGGPAIQLGDPNDPMQLLAAVNQWLKGMHDDPVNNSVPYQWTLSPVAIAEGPLPLNEVDIEHAQDVLKFCAQERATFLDQLNLLNWWAGHPDKYDWTGAATPSQITDAAAATQTDLDTISACASAAMNDPGHAQMPADYATGLGKKFPASQPVPQGPTAKPGPPPGPPAGQPVGDNINVGDILGGDKIGGFRPRG